MQPYITNKAENHFIMLNLLLVAYKLLKIKITYYTSLYPMNTTQQDHNKILT